MLALTKVFVVGHVANRIQMHQRGHGCDHDQHCRGQTVHADRPIAGQCTGFDPTHDLDMLSYAVKCQEHDPRQEGRKEQQPGGHPLCGGFSDEFPPEARDQRADEWGKKDNGFHGFSPSSR